MRNRFSLMVAFVTALLGGAVLSVWPAQAQPVPQCGLVCSTSFIGIGDGGVTKNFTVGGDLTDNGNVYVNEIGTPVNGTFTAGSAGTLTDGTTYYYRVAAIAANGGVGLPSTETSKTTTAFDGGSHGSIVVTWSAVSRAVGYKVYCRSTGAELLCATLGNVLTWTDNGSVTPSGAMPTQNGTGNLYVQGVIANRGSDNNGRVYFDDWIQVDGGAILQQGQALNLDGTNAGDNGIQWNGTTTAVRSGGGTSISVNPGAATITSSGYTLVPTAVNTQAASGSPGLILQTGACVSVNGGSTCSIRFAYDNAGYLRFDNLGIKLADSPLIDGNSYKAPYFAPAAANQKIIEAGTTVLSTGAATVTFSPAFSATPVCVCSEQTALTSVKCPRTTTTMTLTGTGSDSIDWICAGDR